MKKRFLSLLLVSFLVFSQFQVPVSATTITEDDAIQAQINQMTLEQKIGQMIMLDIRQWSATASDTPEDLIELNDDVKQIIDDYNLGGVILFANNVKETEQTAKLAYDLQQVVIDDPSNDIPLFVTIDQEGGVVTRLGTGTQLPGNMAIGATGSTEYARLAGEIIGEELHSLGININFAPSLDVNNNPGNPVIGVRSFGEDPVQVGNLGVAMIQGMAAQDVGVTAKHFPGHGDTATDSHFGVPVVDKSRADLYQTELVPFQMAINEGVDMIMTAHVALPQIESETLSTPDGPMPLPSTLSDDVITGLLREEMGYDGVVITDAMNMDAIVSNTTESEAAIMAINAGVDILLMPTIIRSSADVAKLDTLISDIVNAVNTGVISEEQIDESVYRILKLKVERGIWTPGEPEAQMPLDERIAYANSVVGSPEHKQQEMMIADDAVTLVKNDRDTLPLSVSPEDTVLIVAPKQDQIDSMVSEIGRMRSQGLIGEFPITSQIYGSSTGHLGDNLDIKAKIDQAAYVVFCSDSSTASILDPAMYTYYFGKEVIEYAELQGKDTVLLSMRNPYDGAVFSEADAHLAIYGHKGNPNGPDSESGGNLAAGPNLPAGIRTMFGVNEPQGKLPVTLPKVANGAYSTEDFYRSLGYGIQGFEPKVRFEEKDGTYENLMYDQTIKLEIAAGQKLSEDSDGFTVDVNGTKVNGSMDTGFIEVLESKAAGKYTISDNEIAYYKNATDSAPKTVYQLTTGYVYETGVLQGVIDPGAKVRVESDGTVVLSHPVKSLPMATVTEQYQNVDGQAISPATSAQVVLEGNYTKTAPSKKGWIFDHYLIDGIVQTGGTAMLNNVKGDHTVTFVYKAAKVPTSKPSTTAPATGGNGESGQLPATGDQGLLSLSILLFVSISTMLVIASSRKRSI